MQVMVFQGNEEEMRRFFSPIRVNDRNIILFSVYFQAALFEAVISFTAATNDTEKLPASENMAAYAAPIAPAPNIKIFCISIKYYSILFGFIIRLRSAM